MIAFFGSAENAFSWRADHLDAEVVQLERLISGGGRHGDRSIDRAAMSSCWTEQRPDFYFGFKMSKCGGTHRHRSDDSFGTIAFLMDLDFWNVNTRIGFPLS